MIFTIIDCLRRCHNYIVACMNSHGKNIFHITDNYVISSIVQHYFVFNLLPVSHIFFYENLANHTSSKSPSYNFMELYLVVCNSTAFTSQSVCHSHNYWIPKILCCFFCFIEGTNRMTLEHRNVTLFHRILKLLSILCSHYTRNLSSKYLGSIFFKYSKFVKFYATVQCSLATKS